MSNTHQHRIRHRAQSVDNIPRLLKPKVGNGANQREKGDNKTNDKNCVSSTQSSMNWQPMYEDFLRPSRTFSANRYANHFHNHAKDGFVYWPVDNLIKKPKTKDNKLYTHRNYVSLLIF